jgi:hypothetical protein
MIRKSLQNDRRARATKAATLAQGFLEEGDIRKAFGAIKGWYREAGARPAKPSREELEATRAEQATLHAPRETPHHPIPVHVAPYAIADLPPSEDEVVTAVSKLKTGKAAGATGIKAEHLKAWLRLARPSGENPPDPDPSAVAIWQKILELIRLVFEEGIIPKAFKESILVMIPKEEQGQFRGIALLDVLYKVVSSIIDTRLRAIEFHDALHGSVSGRGTGTAIMEAKLLCQLRCRMDEPIYVVYIDLKKAFYSLDRERALRILEAYGVGPNIRRIISTVWAGDTMVPRQAGYFGTPFLAERGVRVGDNMSPTVFNIVIDAVVRHWEYLHQPIPLEELALFYIDDGAITGADKMRLQSSVDIITHAFESFGLHMNAGKTKFMVVSGGQAHPRRCTAAYSYRVTGEGLSYKERMTTKVQCIKCGTEVSRSYLERHQLTKKCKSASSTYAPPTPVRRRAAEEATIATPHLDPTYYSMSIPLQHTVEVSCPVPDCPFTALPRPQWSQRRAMRLHFRSRHVEDSFCIIEEGLLPKCSRCGLHGRGSNSLKHQTTASCIEHALKRERLAKLRQQQSDVAGGTNDIEFTVGGVPIEQVAQFRYLGRMMDEHDDDSHAMGRQLSRARTKWSRFAAVLRANGVKPRVMGYFYKAVVQAVLLYGSETWVLSEYYLRQLRSFHNRVARCLTDRHIHPNPDGIWTYPPTTEILKSAGLETIDDYIKRRRDTVRNFVIARPLYEECRRSAALSSKAVWWKLD